MFCHANLISRSAGAKRFIWGNCLYKHLVPPGPKTAPGNNSATCCGNFRDRTLALSTPSVIPPALCRVVLNFSLLTGKELGLTWYPEV